ncbi:sigma-70 family RNA polymerase sigma factor [Aminipila butyrica]|uniref:Sigma-70 family RNA polymerase sigma factor n=1 Tax=Aminipila butyrica TaxID=433296 RepID=A0A858BZF6_9FIRM|nr:sigma-70 family RNA polymerase sigma factor [Aminipila butyrica]QIB69466.1 sigma-70 family RNA polymerase sigma factor [Aminipila butyrica]
MISEEEQNLIKKAKEGDEGSFEALILSCKGKAYNLALRYVKDEQDALDVLQESFIKIFRHLDKFKEDSKFETWVYRIVVNTCYDSLRKNKGRQQERPLAIREEEEGGELELPDNQPLPEDVLLNREHSSYLLQCLERIPEEHKRIVVLRDVTGLSYEEIADTLECSIGTVKSRLSRARQRLKEVYISGKT